MLLSLLTGAVGGVIVALVAYRAGYLEGQRRAIRVYGELRQGARPLPMLTMAQLERYAATRADRRQRERSHRP